MQRRYSDAWSDEQERLKGIRLLLSGPEVVFEHLERESESARSNTPQGSRHDIEARLLGRNDRLINLGLAMYGVDPDVFRALYKIGLEPAHDETDTLYKRGLRVGCLSNKSVRMLGGSFPAGLIGDAETERILLEGAGEETAALIRNPAIHAEVLVELYGHKGRFAKVEESRWADLVRLSVGNELLRSRFDCVFALLKVAPVSTKWMGLVEDLLDQLDFEPVRAPERIDHVLTRWAQLDLSAERDEGLRRGRYTDLSREEEFRCLVAAIYGRVHSVDETACLGDPSSQDIALRCAFYAKGATTLRQFKAGYGRDQHAFLLAALFNHWIYTDHLDRWFEEKYRRTRMMPLFAKHRELLRGPDGPIQTAPSGELSALHAGSRTARLVQVSGYIVVAVLIAVGAYYYR